MAKKRIYVPLTEAELAKVEALAKKENRSVAYICQELIKDGLTLGRFLL